MVTASHLHDDFIKKLPQKYRIMRLHLPARLKQPKDSLNFRMNLKICTSFKADLVFWYKARKKVLEGRQTKAPHLPQILAFPKQGQVQTGSLSHKKVFFPYRM